MKPAVNILDMDSENFYSLSKLVQLLKSFLHFLVRKWPLLVLSAVLGLVCGYLYFAGQKPKYEAVSTFILEDRSSTGGNGLAGLASQFGVNINTGSGGGGIFGGDNILSILKSKNIVQRVLLTKSEDTDSSSLADRYLLFKGMKKRWRGKPMLDSLNFKDSNGSLTQLQDSVLNLIYENVIKDNLSVDRTSKQGTIIRVMVIAPDRSFARLMTVRLIDEASKLYLDIKVGTEVNNIKQLQNKADSLLYLLNNKSYSVAANQLLDVNPGIRTAAVPSEIASRDKTVLGTLYAEVVKNLETSKLLLSQQTPVIQVLDRPSYLLDDHKKSLFFLLLVSCILTETILFVGAFIFFIVSKRGFII